MAAAERPWLVLVAGEHWRIAEEAGRWGTHCSLQFIGRAYEQAVDHFGRDHTIVIANLATTMDFLRTAIETGTV